jgi:hypothetical protein
MQKRVRVSLPAQRMGRAALVRRVLVGIAAFTIAAVPAAADAQAWAYPAFQPPRVMNREFNFGVADAGDAGTTLVFQWREGLTQRTHLSFDLGFADPDGRQNGKLLLGVQFGGLLNQATAEMPLDFLATGGLNFAVGEGPDLVRIPFGVSIGHRFALDDGFAIPPYVHPRLSLDICTDCRGEEQDESDSDIGIDFDLGVNFEVTRQLSFRVSGTFGGSDAFRDSDGFGISLAWTPVGLSRFIRR